MGQRTEPGTVRTVPPPAPTGFSPVPQQLLSGAVGSLIQAAQEPLLVLFLLLWLHS